MLQTTWNIYKLPATCKGVKIKKIITSHKTRSKQAMHKYLSVQRKQFKSCAVSAFNQEWHVANGAILACRDMLSTTGSYIYK